MRKKTVALCCALALVASACGSRASKDDLANAAGSESGSTPSGSSQPANGGGDKFGDLPNPCSDGTPGPVPAGVTGVTADSIKLAVISDKAGVVKVPTASIEESMQAFTDFCNASGGINGRKIELTKIDSKLFSHLEATKEACNAGVFAIVGSGSVTDNTGAQQMLDCGLMEVPAYTATAAKAGSDNLVQPLPNPTDSYNAAPPAWVAKTHPTAVKKAAILASNIETATVQAERIIDAYSQVGFEFVYKKYTGVVQESYASEAREMKAKGIEYVTMVSAVSETNKLLHDMKTQGFEPEVIDLGQQYYDPELLTEPGSEGALVQTNTVPFEEADLVPAMQQYLKAYAEVGSKIKPTSLGVQSFSAGLLFATAAKAAGDDLTHDKVLSELRSIHSWTGGGLHYETDPGAGTAGRCFLYLEVKDAEFVRLQPEKAPDFDCPDTPPVTLTGNYGTGAKLKAN